MNHLYLAVFLSDLLVTLALAIVLHFLGSYAGTPVYRRLALVFACAGGFLGAWFAAAYLGVNLFRPASDLLAILQATAYLFVCAAEAVLIDLTLFGTKPARRGTAVIVTLYGILALLLFYAKLSGVLFPRGGDLLYYSKWSAGALLLVCAAVVAVVLVATGRLGELRFPKGFRVLLGLGLFLLAVAGAADLFVLRSRFRTVGPRAMSYPLSATAYLLVSILLLVAASRLTARYRTLLPRVDEMLGRLLTAREREIVSRLLQGESNQTIADRLFIALPTVKNHLHNIYEKLGVSSRTEILHLFLPDK